jgi:feruloyl esterase
MCRHWVVVLSALAVSTFLTAGRASAAASCESLASLPLPHVTITLANLVEAGRFVQFPPGRGAPAPAQAAGRGRGGAAPSPFADLPSFCRVMATLTPSDDSDIKMELWMPAQGWNGNLRGTGNGGLGGGVGVNPGALAAGIRRGYATVGNNTGHEGDSSYALAHPEKIKDFGYRSVHESTVAAKALVKAFYGSGPKVSFIAEGGGGTIAALSSAQRYPEDYDIVAVTGMSSYLTRHTFGQMWIWQATHKDDASFIPPEKYAVLHQAALAACDGLDGSKDGVIGNVERCKFDPGVTVCKGADGPGCLTAPQVEAARKIYAGPFNPRTKEEVYSPLYPGSELGWGQLAGGAQPLGIPVEFFKYYVFRDPKWDYKTRPINFDDDVTLSDRPEIQAVNAVDPDLGPFFARGGKLLLVDGWSDTSVPPKVALNYYKKVAAKVGSKAMKDSMRFFMVPGMGHGPGTAGDENFNFDALGVIEQWKETGKAPDTLIVSHFKNGMEVGKRLVCQYPQVTMYRGSGNTEDTASYACK